jgi:NAD(P)-dependent dehydrogenase (short-subunit alcohol dehydrogenase family)
LILQRKESTSLLGRCEAAKEPGDKRIGVAEDMAGAAIYLASRAGDYVVGDTITVDGGLVHAAVGTSIDA